MRLVMSLYEDGVESTEDLVGDIRLESGNEVIEEKATYLDSWLGAIVEGIEALKAGKAVSIDLIEEPNPLRFELADSSLSISYGATTITVPSMAELEKATAIAAASFLRDVERLTGTRDGELLASIRGFVERTSHMSGRDLMDRRPQSIR